MKHIFHLLTLLGLCFTMQVQAQGINFLDHNAKFAEGVAKAKAEGKLLFVDCYTQWCGPCKAMSNNVFPQKEVGDFMNPGYVSMKIDMEAGEGPELAKKWQVSAYPTFIIFNGDGREVGRFLGGSNAEGFIARVKEKSLDNGSADMDVRFANGERGEDFLYEYLKTLTASYKHDQCNEVAEALLEGKADTFTDDARLRQVFMQHLTNPFCPAFVAVAKNPQRLIDAVGEQQANTKIAMTLSNYGRSLINEHDDTADMDEAQFHAWLRLMEDCGRDNNEVDNLRLLTLIQYTDKKKDWTNYIAHIKEYCQKFDAGDMDLAKWAKPLLEKCPDAAPKLEMAALLQQRVDEVSSGKREPQKRVGNMMLSGNMTKVMENVLIPSLKGEKPNMDAMQH